MSRITQYYDVWATILALSCDDSDMSVQSIKKSVIPPHGISGSRFSAMIRCVFLGGLRKDQDILHYCWMSGILNDD